MERTLCSRVHTKLERTAEIPFAAALWLAIPLFIPCVTASRAKARQWSPSQRTALRTTIQEHLVCVVSENPISRGYQKLARPAIQEPDNFWITRTEAGSQMSLHAIGRVLCLRLHHQNLVSSPLRNRHQ